MNAAIPPWLKRLLACLVGGLVLALAYGNQEGTADDFGLAFHKAVLNSRVIGFLAVGVVLFLLITFWPKVKPHVRRPGAAPLLAGLVFLVISRFVLTWYDGLGLKYSNLATQVSKTDGLSALTTAFFGYLAWTLFALCLIGAAIAVVIKVRVVGYVVAALGVVGAVLAYVAHDDVVSIAQPHFGPDHSFGVYADVFGFLLFAAAGITAVHAQVEVAEPRAFIQRVLDFRPGLLFSGIALVWGLLAFGTSGWFGTASAQNSSINWTISVASGKFKGTGVGALATQYLAYLGWTLFIVCAVLAIVCAYRRLEWLAWATGALSLVSMALTFATLQAMTSTAAREAPTFGAEWQNLGVGGWVACLAFTILAGAMLQCATSARAERKAKDGTLKRSTAEQAGAVVLPMTALVERVRRSASTRGLLLVGIGVALFYPPTLPSTWQNTLVQQIGVYLLLAVGLNVVVGWAGLLDLGFIAFFEIGNYTTAYFVGALPGAQPPSWLHWPSFAVIPIAVLACLIAGVLLGAPTLRLRGDYLAIVTLGFGEIIQVVALNNPGGFSGGAVGPTIPHPHLNFLGINIHFGENNLPYWYVLLILILVVVALFYRLENSRVGRAWAAIREDEVAAQASGINTMRIKLLAFAIGASTSGLAGWFYSTQIGYFDPNQFTLQVSILIVAYVVFGGMGSLVGSMAGAAVLTWLPQFLKSQVPQDDRPMWVGAIVLAMMIFRPAGLLPAKRRKAELEGMDHDEQSETVAIPRAGAM